MLCHCSDHEATLVALIGVRYPGYWGTGIKTRASRFILELELQHCLCVGAYFPIRACLPQKPESFGQIAESCKPVKPPTEKRSEFGTPGPICRSATIFYW
eukprot:1334383-Rhodomonas_salina.1